MIYNTRGHIPDKMILSIDHLIEDSMYNHRSPLSYSVQCIANSVHHEVLS